MPKYSSLRFSIQHTCQQEYFAPLFLHHINIELHLGFKSTPSCLALPLTWRSFLRSPSSYKTSSCLPSNIQWNQCAPLPTQQLTYTLSYSIIFASPLSLAQLPPSLPCSPFQINHHLFYQIALPTRTHFTSFSPSHTQWHPPLIKPSSLLNLMNPSSLIFHEINAKHLTLGLTLIFLYLLMIGNWVCDCVVCFVCYLNHRVEWSNHFFFLKIHLGINGNMPKGHKELIHENITTIPKSIHVK